MKVIKISLLLFLSLYSLTCGSTSATSIVRIDNIFFQFGSAEFAELSEASVTLNKMAMLMKDYPDLYLEVGGHQDVTEKKFNLLSYYRAKKVFDELVSRGININKLRIAYYNWSVPALSPVPMVKVTTKKQKEMARQLNQRVGFMLWHQE